MRRRDLLLGFSAAWSGSFSTQAYEANTKRVGVLVPYAEHDRDSQTHLAAFAEELGKLGWRIGSDLRTEVRWGGGEIGRIQAVAKELVELGPDVLLVRSTPATAALLRETQTIPIVFVVVSDPLGEGFVKSIARPGGNVTGFTDVEASLGGKWLGILREFQPALRRVAVTFNPKTAPGGGSYYLRLITTAASSGPVEVIATPVGTASEIEVAIDTFSQTPGGGLIILPEVSTNVHRKLIVELARRHRLPAVYGFRHFVHDGGLASYGIDITDMYRRAATYVHRILHGVSPDDLPVQAPTKFEFVLNLSTAKALGLSVPLTLQAQADEVIE